ncbi:hypothetical protein [uncultured Helicobacter sp.]|uniref:hypothetical protein n=1 Tax=uncultured Helicobacter sp. TaxID=175537 RepID=UPI001C3A6F37|nr:hypothetical protein [Candidatus Helicobacter avicola]
MSLKNISFSIYAFFIGLLLLSAGSMLFFKQDESAYKEIGTNIPTIEIGDFEFFLLTPQPLSLVANGSKILRYNAYDEGYEIFAYQLDSQRRTEEYYAPYLKAVKDMYYAPQSIRLVREDGLVLWSKKGVYDYKKRIFKGEGQFFLTQEETDLQGFNVYFDQNKEYLQGENLGGFIQLAK